MAPGAAPGIKDSLLGCMLFRAKQRTRAAAVAAVGAAAAFLPFPHPGLIAKSEATLGRLLQPPQFTRSLAAGRRRREDWHWQSNPGSSGLE